MSETPNPTQPNPTQPITDHGHSSSGSDRTVLAIARFKPTKVGAPSLFDGATLSETEQKPAWCARQKIRHGAARGFGMTMGGCCPGAPILIGLHHSNTHTTRSRARHPTQPNQSQITVTPVSDRIGRFRLSHGLSRLKSALRHFLAAAHRARPIKNRPAAPGKRLGLEQRAVSGWRWAVAGPERRF